jgi:uncharacterized RDD family membrane protein YckC
MIDPSGRVGIRTPEGVTFHLTLAGPVARFLAFLIDLACIVAAVQTTNRALTALNVLSADLAAAVSILLYFAISIGYAMALEWFWNGRTVGKSLLRLKVVDAQGLRLRPTQVIVRNLLRFIDSLPFLYLVGGAAVVLSPHRRRLGDIAAGTMVIRRPKIAPPNVEQLQPGHHNSFRRLPHIEARLRQNVSPQEADLAAQALMRRDELDPEARLKLFRQLADHFKTKAQFPEEINQALSDEQYIRNVVDTMYRG